MSNFEMRAAPRRRTKQDGNDDQPVFLRKAYGMITNCPPHIGGWSPNGETVLVKDVEQFAASVIPTAFKHNNFSSFVRQLNFYGFRKIKSELSEKEQWWEFRHPRFQRGKQEWLSEIKRSVHIENSSTQEVYDLRNQVSTLHDRVASLTDKIAQLTNVVEILISNPHHNVPAGIPLASEYVDASSKKRRVDMVEVSDVDSESTVTDSHTSHTTNWDKIDEDFSWEDIDGLFEQMSEGQVMDQPVLSTNQLIGGPIFDHTIQSVSGGFQQKLKIDVDPPSPNSVVSVSASESVIAPAVDRYGVARFPPHEHDVPNPVTTARFVETLSKLFTPEAMALLTEKFEEFSRNGCLFNAESVASEATGEESIVGVEHSKFSPSVAAGNLNFSSSPARAHSPHCSSPHASLESACKHLNQVSQDQLSLPVLYAAMFTMCSIAPRSHNHHAVATSVN